MSHPPDVRDPEHRISGQLPALCKFFIRICDISFSSIVLLRACLSPEEAPDYRHEVADGI